MELLAPVFGAAVIGIVIGGVLSRIFSPRVAIWLGLAVLALAVVLLITGSLKQGWDGLGYTVAAVIFATPIAAGSGLVGLIAWYFSRKQNDT